MPNLYKNKFQKSTGEVLMDLTSDTVTPETLLQGETAHDRSGAAIVGTVIVAPTDVTEAEDNTAYLYKNSEHDAVYDELIGGSVAWNQLVPNSGSSLSVTITSGHKYIMKKSGTLSVGASSGSAITGLTGGTDWITDLTLMFGATIADYVYNLEQSTAGSGIAWLKSYGFFTKDYYAYNAGGLVSVNTSGKKVVGKNLLEITANSQTINGVIFTVDKAAGTITANGTATAQAVFVINNNVNIKMPYRGCLWSDGSPSGSSVNTYFLNYEDSNGKNANCYANQPILATNTSYPNTITRALIYIRSGQTVSNLVFKPTIRRADVTDSTFEPYTSLTYPIQSTDLRGLYKLDSNNKIYTDGDIYSADGQITRKYGIVDLGTLNWQLTSGVFTPTTDIGAKVQSIQGTLANILCPKYVTIQQNQISGKDKVIFGLNWGTGVGIIDSFYATAATFKTAMSGVYLIYELATPITETAQPFTSPQMVYRNGTEEYLDTRDVPMPVGGNRKYIDIPEWMINEYFDDMRADSSIIDDIKKEADTLEEHLKAFIIESNIGKPTRINNASDFTVELFDKIWGTNTDLYPRFAHLFLFGNEAHFLKAIIESIVVNTYTPTYTSEKLIQATFISEMSMYYFRWVRGQAPSMNKYTISVT